MLFKYEKREKPSKNEKKRMTRVKYTHNHNTSYPTTIQNLIINIQANHQLSKSFFFLFTPTYLIFFFCIIIFNVWYETFVPIWEEKVGIFFFTWLLLVFFNHFNKFIWMDVQFIHVLAVFFLYVRYKMNKCKKKKYKDGI